MITNFHLADLKLAAALSGPGETAEKQKLAAYQAVYAKYVRETVDETNHHLKMMDRELDFQQVAIYNEKQRQQLLENITKQIKKDLILNLLTKILKKIKIAIIKYGCQADQICDCINKVR